MIAKVLCLAVVVVAATAHPRGHVAVSSQVIHRHDGPVEKVVRRDHDEHGHGREHVDYHAHPKYEYAYSVEDKHTGDIKSQHETRDGDVVKGYYALVQPDGSVRHVEYYADKHTGFHANVKYTHPLHHVEPHREHH